MGAVYRSKGKFAEGLLACQRAMKLDPATYVGHRMAGLCCLGLRRYDEAIGYFEFAAVGHGVRLHGFDIHLAVLQGQG